MKCFFGQRTLDDLLRIISEELTERGPLGPLQGVEQLLDLSGHSAAYRNSYKPGEGVEEQQQGETYSHSFRES